MYRLLTLSEIIVYRTVLYCTLSILYKLYYTIYVGLLWYKFPFIILWDLLNYSDMITGIIYNIIYTAYCTYSPHYTIHSMLYTITI